MKRLLLATSVLALTSGTVLAPGIALAQSAIPNVDTRPPSGTSPGWTTLPGVAGKFMSSRIGVGGGNYNPTYALNSQPLVPCNGNCDLVIGQGAGANLVAVDTFTTLVGVGAGHNMVGGNGASSTESTCIGFEACYNMTTGVHNVALGIAALANDVTGSSNIAIGTDSLKVAQNPSTDIAIGDSVMSQEIGAGGNIVIGNGDFKGNSATEDPTSANITIVGQHSWANTPTGMTLVQNIVSIGDHQVQTTDLVSAVNDVFIGSSAANQITTDNYDVAVGDHAGSLMQGTTYNTLVGNSAGRGVSGGIKNTLIGACLNGNSNCYNQVTTGGDNTTLGFFALVPSATANDQLSIKNMIFGLHLTGTGNNTSPGTIGVGTQVPNAALTIGNNGGTADDGHLGFLATAVPVLSACGTGSPAVDATANDASGTITEGTTATGCVLTFSTAYQTAPHCVVSSPTANAFTSYTPATTTLTIVNGSASGNKYTYLCTQ